MNSEIRISLRGVCKNFKIYPSRKARIKEWLSFGKRQFFQEVSAVKNINLEIRKGEVFGIIGMNGAGKSTLLKMITGTLASSKGEIQLTGKVAALLELGTGFHEELSGRENVLTNGKLLGLTDEEIRSRVESIKAFSELKEYFESPVRTYSTGMYVRLAFSLAASVDPDILIIDEALSVGDAYFQQKCLRKIEEFKQKGVTILFVSHDLGAVKILCDRAAILSQGEMVAMGSPLEMVEQYNALLSKREGISGEYIVKRREKDARGREILSSGNKKVEILKVSLFDQKNAKIEAFEAGSFCSIVVDVLYHDEIRNPTVGILIRDNLGYDIFGTNTANMHFKTGHFKKGEKSQVSFACKMHLGPGDYTITVAAHTEKTHETECYEWVDRILSFKVLPRTDFHFIGAACLEPSVNITNLS